jgi:hypothetical protein
MVLAATTIGSGLGSIVRDSSLITYYDPSLSQSYSGSGATFTDLSGNSNTGTLQNSPTFNTTNFSLNGTNQHITTTTSFVNPQAYTTCIWFRTTSTAGRVLLQFENSQTGAGTSYDRRIWIGTNGLLYIGIYTGLVKYIVLTSPSVTDGAWRYISAHYNGTDLSLYLNGSLVYTYLTIGAAQSYTGWWRIGSYKSTAWTFASDGYFTGNVGPIQIYNRSLSTDEILQNFNAQRGRFGV